jgi:flagellar hook-basal body complex protein FliE
MRVELLVPDAPPSWTGASDDTGAFAQAVDAIGTALAGADRAEDDFAVGNGPLEAAVYERARADVALSVATATAQRATQALQSIFNMQV